MRIDPGSHVPIYLQIAEGVRGGIAAGVYRPDEAIPSLRALALQVQVNPNTVQRAYDLLLREGLVYAQRGKGLFVAQQSADPAQSHAEGALHEALEDAIRAARAAGISVRTIRSQFQLALQQTSSSRGNRHE